jgi:predicted unusual protein kinase regulating ubiquinone biosynthesis (AarF/ABC1/UbiB family)
MRHQIFHADPHPANLIVMSGGTLGWVDFGIVGWLDEETWQQQFRLRAAISSKRFGEAYERLLTILEPLPPVDLSEFELEAKTIMRDWTMASEFPCVGMETKSSGLFFMRLFAAVRAAGLSFPARVMRLYRAMIIADMVMLKLDPAIDWLHILRAFVTVETGRRGACSWAAFLPDELRRTSAGIGRMTSLLAKLVNWVEEHLPKLSRRYERDLSVTERMVLNLGYVLRIAIVAGLIWAIWFGGRWLWLRFH